MKNVNEVAMEAGNRPEVIFKHYRELVTEKEADAWFGVTPEAVKAAKTAMEKKRAENCVISKTFTASLPPKAKLAEFLGKWRGAPGGAGRT